MGGFNFTEEELRKKVPGGGIAGVPDVQIQPAPASPESAPFDWGSAKQQIDYPDPSKLGAFRAAADNARFYEDQTDTNVLNSQRYRDFVNTGNYTPSSQAFPDNEKQGANFGQGAAASPATQRVNVPGLGAGGGVGSQFDDPYTKQLEAITSAQMGEVRSNPGLDQLKAFLNQQFQNLSQNPGFSPEEMAVLNTQAFEPIEANRQASKQRALERTSARGMLPSSGLNELDMRDIEIAADKSRAAAGRDVAINAIDRRDSDLSRAGQIATQLGTTIPGQQRSEELSLASLLYDLPRKALQDALAVTQGSPTANDLFSQSVRLADQNQQNSQQNQLLNQQKWAQIASILPYLDF